MTLCIQMGEQFLRYTALCHGVRFFNRCRLYFLCLILQIVHMPNTKVYRNASSIEKRGYDIISTILELPKLTKSTVTKLQQTAAALASTVPDVPVSMTDIDQCSDFRRWSSVIRSEQATDAASMSGDHPRAPPSSYDTPAGMSSEIGAVLSLTSSSVSQTQLPFGKGLSLLTF